MLKIITSYEQIKKRQYMDIYARSNLENTDYFFPHIKDKKLALQEAERSHLNYLKTEFLNGQNFCAVWMEQERWLSAMRVYAIEENRYYIEALETRPAQRGKGYVTRLLCETILFLKERGCFTLSSCVSKRNFASLKAHQNAGFRIVSDPGFDYLQNRSDEMSYGLTYFNQYKD